ncbi:MAG TPA: restriction endonuclease subunit S [Cytophagaceae bacterium]|nr:restriction endonuclease subunit S [Cytophagaceae bacterium]
MPHIDPKILNDLEIEIPSLNEQKKIVTKLDALMKRINSNKKRLEKIPILLKRFRQSVLSEAMSGQLTEEWRRKNSINNNWEELQLIDVIKDKPKNGYSAKPVNHKTPYRVLTLTATTSGKFIKEHYKYFDEPISTDSIFWIQPNDILIQRGNTIEYVGVSAIYDGEPNEYIFPDLMMRVKAKDLILTPFLYYQLTEESSRNYLRDRATGTSGNMPKINQPTLMSLPVLLPTLQEQQEIVKHINELFSLADKIQARYTKAKKMLDKLSQSILVKAFKGELLSNDELKTDVETITKDLFPIISRIISPQVADFPVVLESVNTTDLHAGILALIIQAHERSEHVNKLNHIKGEKISHLVEYHLGISLGRNPVKDAAGPDDYPHLKKVESRATKSGWFKIQKKDIGYTYLSNSTMNNVIDKLKKNLSVEQFDSVQNLIQTFLPFHMVDSEVIATVHAGWNNLLLEGKTPTDEEIVYESRENWSKRKLEIDRQVFFGAINWIKKNGFEPKGKGKKIDKGKNKK